MKISDLAFTTPTDTTFHSLTSLVRVEDVTLSVVSEETPDDPGTIEERFQAICKRSPERLALLDEKNTMTFSELNRFSAAIAGFILGKELPLESPVAVMCSRSRLFVASFLGIIRANAVYVPLDPMLPLKRREMILNDCKANMLITDSRFAGDAERLTLTCPELRWLLSPDVDHFEDAIEKPGELMSIELWNHVTDDAADGSWKSFFDGQPLSAKVVNELATNLYEKTKSRLGKESRVLDIGSGAGSVARMLMSHCRQYTSVDLSRKELGRVENMAMDFTSLGVATHQIEALDIHLLSLEGYDLVVLNSVIENFPGYNYLRRVLDHAVAILGDGGLLFVGSVWDMEKKSLFFSDLEKHGRATGDYSGMVRLDQGDELFVPKSFFEEWAASCSCSVDVSFTPPRIESPELRDYRFDVMIRKRLNHKKTSPAVPVTRNGVDLKDGHGFAFAHPTQSTESCRMGKAPACPSETDILKTRYGSSSLPFATAGEKIGFPPLSPDSAVYMIYTSGTTGKPKGVVIPQEGLLNLFNGLNTMVYGKANPLNIALLASFSFDASMQQITAALLGGHSLHIVPDRVKTDPQALYHFLETRAIDVCDGTPSLFSLLIDYCLDQDRACPVNTFILGGEMLKSELLIRYFSMEGHGSCKVFNAYGPTECSVDATLYEFNLSNHDVYGVPPIGYALPHTEITVRGKNHDILPEGLPGELWIRGRGLARGYFGDKALTNSRFVMAEGKRWYRTGDMGRSTKNHLFFFNGRDDHQVKVGGFRVEIGEIEAVLNGCPLVKNAVVTADDFSGNGVNTLACFFVPNGKPELSRIRDHLRRNLPAYAVPTHYVTMTSLPLTANGKIDYHSLPSPIERTDCTGDEAQRPLHGPIEKQIAELWERLLGRKIESADSDFFELGGHSILGVRLISLMEKKFGKRLSLSHLFKATTISSQAELVEKSLSDDHTHSPLIPFSTQGSGPPVFLFHPVGGHAFRYQPLAKILADRYPVYGVEAPGIHNDSPWLLSVEEMADMYLSEMKTRFPGTPFIFAGWSFGGLVAFEAARQFEQRGGQVKGVILLDTVADNRMAKELVKKDEAAMLVTLFSETIPVTEMDFRSKTGDERLDYLIDLGVRHGMLPTGFGVTKMRRLLQIYHGNALAAARYSPAKSKGKALLIRPSEPLASAMNIPDEPLQGWKSLFEKGMTLNWITGNHESMMMEHSAKKVADCIYTYLDEMDKSDGEDHEN